MKIEVLCGSGSPVGIVPSDIYGNRDRIGIGGAELALFTLCEGWHNQGHEVVLYNNPRKASETFEQRPVHTFDRNGARDVVIAFREPTDKIYRANGKKVFFSCDQYTVGDFRHFSQFVDKVVTISPYHSEYFAKKYEIRESVSIDLPVRDEEYSSVEKIPYRMVFTSVPDRGLDIVAKTYPRVVKEVPDASLVITSDYRLWGATSPLNQQHLQKFIGMKNVQFLGAVGRKRLIEEQLKSQIHFYPCTYEELFCISVAESQMAGVLPITSDYGALRSTNMGVIIQGNPNDKAWQDVFVERTIFYLKNQELANLQSHLREKAMERFSLHTILNEWNEKVFNG